MHEKNNSVENHFRVQSFDVQFMWDIVLYARYAVNI